MSILTIFTCTYNRANLLSRTYASLCRQTCSRFEWLIVDDGSTDGTRELAQGWIDENKIKISYLYKQNGGLHTGYNVAYRAINTELCMCVDSDDWLPEDSVETILKVWGSAAASQYGGIVGLNIDQTGNLIGSRLPERLSSPYRHLYTKYKVTGDKKFVFRTDMMKQIPEFPEYSGEKCVPSGYKFIQIPDSKELLIINKPLCIIDYQASGMSAGIRKQYFKNPKGMAAGYEMSLRYAYGIKQQIKCSIGYVVFSLIAGNRYFLVSSPKPLSTLIFFPVGLAGYIYVLAKWGKYKIT